MKLPVIRNLQKSLDKEQLETALEVLEVYSEHRSVTDEENDVIGEMITNICGAIQVHENIENGMNPVDAANSFAQQVMGSIDR